MKIHYNKKTIKTILSIGVPICMVASSFSGCATNGNKGLDNPSTPSKVYVTLENITKDDWNVVKYTDGTYQMVKLIGYEHLGSDGERSYYMNAFGEYHVDLILDHYCSEDMYWVETEKDVESCIKLSEYLEHAKKDLVKDSYSESDIKFVYKYIVDNYDKKIDDKDKILIKENSLY